MTKSRDSQKILERQLLKTFIAYIESNDALISVTKLCDANGISRTTFYKHFPSLDYFLKLTIKGFVSELITITKLTSYQDIIIVKKFLNNLLSRKKIINYIFTEQHKYFLNIFMSSFLTKNSSLEFALLSNIRCSTLITLITSFLNENSTNLLDFISYTIIYNNNSYFNLLRSNMLNH